MSTGNFPNWDGNVLDLGPLYPFVGSEILMVIVLIVLWVAWHLLQMKGENDELDHRVAHFRQHGELQKALERVSELSQLKANFVSNISHELRTPLTHIKGYVELLVTESLGSITDEQTSARIHGERVRLVQVVRSLPEHSPDYAALACTDARAVD